MKTKLEVGNGSKNIPTKVQKPFRKEEKRRHTMWYHTLGTVYMYFVVVPIAAGRETMLAVLLLPGCGATRPARNSLHYIVQFLDCRRRRKNCFFTGK